MCLCLLFLWREEENVGVKKVYTEQEDVYTMEATLLNSGENSGGVNNSDAIEARTVEAQTADMQIVKVSVSTPLMNTIPNNKEPHHLKTPGKLTVCGIKYGLVNAFLQV